MKLSQKQSIRKRQNNQTRVIKTKASEWLEQFSQGSCEKKGERFGKWLTVSNSNVCYIRLYLELPHTN